MLSYRIMIASVLKSNLISLSYLNQLLPPRSSSLLDLDPRPQLHFEPFRNSRTERSARMHCKYEGHSYFRVPVPYSHRPDEPAEPLIGLTMLLRRDSDQGDRKCGWSLSGAEIPCISQHIQAR